MSGARAGLDVAIATPKGYEPDDNVAAVARGLAVVHGGSIRITNDPARLVGAAAGLLRAGVGRRVRRGRGRRRGPRARGQRRRARPARGVDDARRARPPRGREDDSDLLGVLAIAAVWS